MTRPRAAPAPPLRRPRLTPGGGPIPPGARVMSPEVLTPGECAASLGVPVPVLVEILREYRSPWTELRPGGRPGDRGRGRWGMTPGQLRDLIAGQERRFAPLRNRMHSIEAKPIEAIVPKPMQCILDRKRAHLRHTIVDGQAPGLVELGLERGAAGG